MERTWFLHLRDYLARMNAKISTPNAWVSKLTQEKDFFEVFHRLPNIIQAKLVNLNSVRLFLNVITLVDIANPDGTHIEV